MTTQYLGEGFKALGDYGSRFFQENKAHIFTGLSLIGTAATGVLCAKDGARAARRIDQESFKLNRELTTKEKIKLCWRDYIDGAVAGVLTGASTVMSDVVNTRTIAEKNQFIADQTALLLASERAYKSLSEKTKKIVGEKKQKEITDEVAKEKVIEKIKQDPNLITQDKINSAPRVGNGQLFLFLEEYSGLLCWTNLDYLEKWALKMNEMMKELEPRDRELDYAGKEKGVPYSEWISVLGYDRKTCNTPERRHRGWNKGFAKDGSDDDVISFTRSTMEWEPGVPVNVIIWDVEPQDMRLGYLLKGSAI